MISTIHVSLHHISIQWVPKSLCSPFMSLQEKLQLEKYKLHHWIKHVPSTSENNKDKIVYTTL